MKFLSTGCKAWLQSNPQAAPEGGQGRPEKDNKYKDL